MALCGESGYIRVKMVELGQSVFFGAKEVAFVQS